MLESYNLANTYTFKQNHYLLESIVKSLKFGVYFVFFYMRTISISPKSYITYIHTHPTVHIMCINCREMAFCVQVFISTNSGWKCIFIGIENEHKAFNGVGMLLVISCRTNYPHHLFECGKFALPFQSACYTNYMNAKQNCEIALEMLGLETITFLSLSPSHSLFFCFHASNVKMWYRRQRW